MVFCSKYCGPGTDSLTHRDDQLVMPHTWVVPKRTEGVLSVAAKFRPEIVTI
jgi:hypothetical protein